MAYFEQAGYSDVCTTPNGGGEIGEASKTLVKANRDRITLEIFNDSESARIYVSKSAKAELGKGIVLYPKGGAYVMRDYTGEVCIIATAASTKYTYSET